MVRYALDIVVKGYLAVGLAYGVLRVTVGERFFLVLLGNIFLHWVLLLAPLLMIAALLMRLWWQSAILGLVVLMWAGVYGGRFLPGAGAEVPPDALRVMTFNTAASYTSPDALIAQIEDIDADVVALIELGGLNGEIISERLLKTYPYQIVRGQEVEGKALLSRYPIVRQDVFFMQTQRPNIEVELLVGEQRVVVFVVHPPSPDFQANLNFYVPDPANAAEIEMLLERVTERPTLLLGDFNITEHSRSYRQIQRAGFGDAYRAVGVGFGNTYYSWVLPGLALTRIDYVWHSAQFVPLAARVGERGESDHAPVIVDLVLR